MRNDFPLSHQAKLVLVDLDLHGNKVEDHFQQGPLTTRQVLVTPALVSRHGLLRVAEVDRYCTSENDRCLVFHNSHRWPDYDERARLISHADYVRIAVPPSEGFACPTRDLVQMRQDGFTDAEMLDVIYNDEVISGYSPSLLGDEDVAALATPHASAEGDHFLALQTTLSSHSMKSEEVKTAVHEQFEGSFDCPAVLSHADSTCPTQLANSPMKPLASLTDEFLQAVEAARNAGEEVPPPIDPHAIEAQPQAFQDIWASSTTLIEFGPMPSVEFLRVESWYLNHVNFHRCHTSRITLLNADYVRWKEQLAATWNDKVTNVHDLSFALVSPLPEDCATNIVAQLIITERESPELRSAVLSVYDSAEEMERNPHTFAIVLRRRLNLFRLMETLHLQMDCPPVNIRNLCSLWFGTVPIGPSHEVNLQAGNAFRLVVSRGVFIDIPSILTLDDAQIRRVLQRAIHTEIYDRPPDPSFLAYGQSNIDNGSSWVETGASSDGRPPWIPILERHFQTGSIQQTEDASATLPVVTWYLNSEAHFHCDFPRTVSLTDESFMWRTDCIFPWRDRLMRGAVVEPIALHHPLPTAVSDNLFPHVIVVQGLTDEQCAVIISVQGTDGLTIPRRQFAHVFQGRASGCDIIRLAVLEEHTHRPAIIRMSGQTYFPDDTLAISTGTSLSVLISGTTLDIHTEEHADGLSLMQHNVTYDVTPVMCKPAGFGRPDDFPVSTVSSHAQRPPRPHHDGAVEWSETLHRVFIESGERNLWNDDVTLQVATWFIHHENRPVCHRPRFLRLHDNPITWIEELRAAWENLLDPRLPFTILLIQPNPPQFRAHRIACHIILEQARTDQQAAVLLTALLEGLSQDGMIQGAYSVHDRVNCASIIRTMEISFQCADRPCTLFHHRQPFSSEEWVDVHSGVSLYIRLRAPRSATGDQELEPAFFQHFEDLTLMQTQLVGSNPLVSEGRNGRSQVRAQPKHIQDLFARWENSTFVGEEESRALHVLTWFVAPGAGVLKCMNSRKVTLFADFRQWEGQLTASWTPLLDPRLPTTIVVAYPEQPHLEPSIEAHVLLLQREVTNWSSPIVTIFDPAWNHGIPFRVVTTVPRQGTPSDILASFDNPHIQGVHCQVWHKGHLMAADRFDIEHGTDLQVHIYQQTVHPWNEPEQDSDESVQMQHGLPQSLPQPSGNTAETGTSGCATFSFNIHATEFIPSQPSVSTLPEHLQDLHAMWDRHAWAWEDEVRKTSVQTWYLSPGTNQLRCGFCRKVHLFENYMQWEQDMIHAWADQIKPNRPVFFYIVKPTPIALEHDIVAHILLVQEPIETQVNSLVTVFDPAIHNGHPFRIAVVTHEHITQHEIIERIGYADDMRKYGNQIQCTFQHASFVIPVTSAVPGHDGDHVILSFRRQRVDANWNPPFLPVAPGMEGIQFLQRASTLRKIQAKGDILLDEPQTSVRIEMRPAIDAFEWTDTHFLMMSFVPPDEVQIPFESKAWLDLPLWAAENGGDEIWLYLDGSYQKDVKQAGLAVAVFIKSSGRWYQAGFISAQVDPLGSYPAELFAAIVAAKTVHDVLKLCTMTSIEAPLVFFCYDSMTVGKQLLGDWKCTSYPLLGRCMRMFIDLVEARFKVACQGTHIHSHKGEPGNELVDALANGAAKGIATHDLDPFFQHVLCKPFIEAGEWMRFLFDEKYAAMWDHTQIQIPSSPTTQPTTEVLPGLSSPEDQSVGIHGTLALTLATGNVLTLKGKIEVHKHSSIAGPTRQAALLQQLHEAGVHIFALQETRLRKQHCAGHPDFLLFSSPATEAGHYGIMIGFNTKLSHGTWTDTTARSSDVFFEQNHFAVIARNPRLLIVRVRTPIMQAIVIAAHAPHSGALEQEIEEWWQCVDRSIPTKYRQWARILLVDANARIGSFPSESVGSWQAENDTAKSEPFLQFLHQNSLWVPATFETCQFGAGGTWRHNNGHWLRNDFVALPLAWNCHQVKAYVSEDVDLSTVKEDHALAVVELKADITPVNQAPTGRSSKRTDNDLDCVQNLKNTAAFVVPWSVDVHTHAHELQCHLVRQIPKKRKAWKPLKATMTESTWELVKAKKFWRNQMWEGERTQRYTRMQMCFMAWKTKQITLQTKEFQTILKQQDHLCATAYHSFRQLGRQVVTAMRSDDAAFFDRLARQAGELVHPHQAREFWRVIRRSLPQMKLRRQQVSPMQLEHLEDQWHPYFQVLEVGTTITPEQLLQECCAYQRDADVVADVCQLHEPPSRAQLVNAFRDTQPHKATGLDPIPSGLAHRFPVQMAAMCWDLFLKIFTWQQEPIQAKGGILAVIPKKNDQSRAAHFRGIMLPPTIYKRLHAVLREQVIQVIAPLKPAGQIGGFKNQQVQFGSMGLQCFSRIASAYNLSMGVVFVDLANAFHRLIPGSWATTSYASKSWARSTA